MVASLWLVEDKAGRQLMTDFYENLWQKKLPKIEALRQAQLSMLENGISRGLVAEDDDEKAENLAASSRRITGECSSSAAIGGDRASMRLEAELVRPFGRLSASRRTLQLRFKESMRAYRFNRHGDAPWRRRYCCWSAVTRCRARLGQSGPGRE